MTAYLMTLTDEDASWLEQWMGGRLILGPAGDIQAGVAVASLDVVPDRDARRIRKRLEATS